MDVRASFIDTSHKGSDKLVDLHPIITNITDFKSIIEKDVRFKLIIIRVHHFQVLLSHTSSTLVLVHTEQRLQHFTHFTLSFMPHGGTSINPSDAIRSLGFGSIGLA